MSNTAHHTFETPEQLHAWLQANHASETEQWVRIFKKATGQPSVTWDDCVVAAISWAGSMGYARAWMTPHFCNASRHGARDPTGHRKTCSTPNG